MSTATHPSDTVAALGHVEAISLDALNEVAALQTRTDRKYILGPAELAALLSQLPHSIRVLEIGGQRSFGYESTYFDTPDHTSYRSAAHRRRQRWKVRIRSYETSPDAMLEIKTKDGRGHTVKTRTGCGHGERHTLDRAARGFVAETIGDADSSGRLIPSLTTAYRRTTFVDLADASRLTVDRDLVCTDWTGRRATIGNHAIIETKSSGSPSATDRWLWSRGLRPTKVSKYCTGLAALQPELPHNKWHRVLQRHWTVSGLAEK